MRDMKEAGGLWNQNNTASVRAAMQKISHKLRKGVNRIIIKAVKDEFANITIESFDAILISKTPDTDSPCWHCGERDFGQTCGGDKCKKLAMYKRAKGKI